MAYFGFFEKRLKNVPLLSAFPAEVREQAQRHYRDALATEDAGDASAAIAHYTKAIDLVPVFWEALDNRGLCFMRLGAFQEATQGFELSTQINPDSPLALMALIKCYRKAQHNVNAMHVAQYCVQKWPDKSPFADWNSILGSHG